MKHIITAYRDIRHCPMDGEILHSQDQILVCPACEGVFPAPTHLGVTGWAAIQAMQLAASANDIMPIDEEVERRR